MYRPFSREIYIYFHLVFNLIGNMHMKIACKMGNICVALNNVAFLLINSVILISLFLFELLSQLCQ